MPPCSNHSFNTKTYLNPFLSCLYSHDQNEYSSYQLIPGGPNYCKDDILGSVGIGKGCHIKAGKCCYAHIGDAAILDSDQMDVILLNLLNKERLKRRARRKNGDLDAAFQKTFAERFERHATERFVAVELVRSYAEFEAETRESLIVARICEVKEEEGRTGEHWLLLLKRRLMEEHREFDEKYFVEKYLLPCMEEEMPRSEAEMLGGRKQEVEEPRRPEAKEKRDGKEKKDGKANRDGKVREIEKGPGKEVESRNGDGKTQLKSILKAENEETAWETDKSENTKPVVKDRKAKKKQVVKRSKSRTPLD